MNEVNLADNTHIHSVHTKAEQRQHQQTIHRILLDADDWLECDAIDKASGWTLGSHVLHCALAVLLADGRIEARNNDPILLPDGKRKIIYTHDEMLAVRPVEYRSRNRD